MNKILERAKKEHCKLTNNVPDEKYLNELDKIDKFIELIKEQPWRALVSYDRYTYKEWIELFNDESKELFENEDVFNLLKEFLL